MKTKAEKVNYFALKPLATRLISSSRMEIRSYETGKGLTTTETCSFSAIDLDVWARQFLQAVDDFLAVFATTEPGRAQATMATLSDTLRENFERVTQTRTTLAGTIAEGIDYLFAVPGDTRELARIKDGLEQLLSAGLSSAYATDTLFESPAVLSFAHGRPVPCLSGLPSGISRDAIPVPLRLYPALPSLLTQSGTAACHAPADIRQARQWNFEATLQRQWEDQDALYVTILFENTEKAATLEPSDPSSELFDALAQFIKVYPAIKSDMANGTSPADQDNNVIETAVLTFADLAERVAENWSFFRPQASSDADGAGSSSDKRVYRLARMLATDCTPARLESIILEVKEPDASLPTAYPRLWVLAADGRYYEMASEAAGDGRRRYTCDAAWPWTDGSTLRIVTQNLDLFQTTMAQASVSVMRNERLGSALQVNSEFIYQTPPVSFGEPCVPFVQHDTKFDIEILTDLKASLLLFFTELFARTKQPLPLKVAIEYRYTIAYDDHSPREVALPVLSTHLVPYESTFGANVAEETMNWWQANGQGKGGTFVMQVAVFTSAEKPLLELSNIRFCLA